VHFKLKTISDILQESSNIETSIKVSDIMV